MNLLPIIIIALVLILPLLVMLVLIKLFIRRYDMDKYSFSLRTEDIEDGISIRHVSFDSCGEHLHGYIIGEATETMSQKLIVISHGLFGGAEEYLPFAIHFCKQGYTVFMFDNTGCNRSGGKNIKSALQGLIDLNSAMKFIMEQPTLKDRKKILVGHSWGGFTVAAFKPKSYNIEKVVSMAGFDTVSPAINDCLMGMYGNWLRITLPYCYLVMLIMHGNRFNTSSIKNINKTGLPYLIIQGNADRIIHCNSSSIYNHASKITNENVQLKLLTDPKHNKHDTIFRDAESVQYMISRYRLMRAARKEYKGDRLNAELEKIYNETDRFKVNQLDKELLQLIDNFIE